MVIDKLKDTFPKAIVGTEIRNDRRATLTIDPSALVAISRYLHHELGFRFIIASALHTRKGFEIYYHFSFDQTGLILNLHVILDSEQPEVESLSNMFEATNWIEREMHELFGINFLNHPNLEELLSEGNWAKGVYPYRKVFSSKGEAST
ncbi:MAG: NADH-quinone oxidoreductase subunit C [Bacteroidota bacterium]